jgi:hypothetical protein
MTSEVLPSLREGSKREGDSKIFPDSTYHGRANIRETDRGFGHCFPFQFTKCLRVYILIEHL